MSMELINTHSDLFLGIVDSTDAGFSFEDKLVTHAAGMKAGALIKADGTWAAPADAANIYGILGDIRYLEPVDPELVVGQQYTARVGVRSLTAYKNLLKYNTGAVIDTAGINTLNAKNIKVTDKVYG